MTAPAVPSLRGRNQLGFALLACAAGMLAVGLTWLNYRYAVRNCLPSEADDAAAEQTVGLAAALMLAAVSMWLRRTHERRPLLTASAVSLGILIISLLWLIAVGTNAAADRSECESAPFGPTYPWVAVWVIGAAGLLTAVLLYVAVWRGLTSPHDTPE